MRFALCALRFALCALRFALCALRFALCVRARCASLRRLLLALRPIGTEISKITSNGQLETSAFCSSLRSVSLELAPCPDNLEPKGTYVGTITSWPSRFTRQRKGCPSNAIRYDVFTEYYRILSRTVRSAPMGAKALLTAFKTSCKLACMSSCVLLFVQWPQLFTLKFNP